MGQQHTKTLTCFFNLRHISKVIIVIIILLSGFVLASPVITSVVPEDTIVSKYEKFQMDINLTADYSNPFDPYDINVKGFFTGPSGQFFEIMGFWDGSDWLVRFSPNEVGEWTYHAWVNDYTGTATSITQSFTCTESDHHGFIRISDDNPHYLEYSDDSPFFGIGQCRAWYIYEQVPSIFTDMSNVGMNTLVYWMPSWDNLLVRDATGYDHYDLTRAAEIDRVVEDCEDNDISLIFTIWNHDEIRGAGHPWNIRPYYDLYNPFRFIPDPNNPSPVNLFFTEATHWYYQWWLYRYIIARWGYSRAIQQWHTVCEIDGTGNSWFNLDDPNDYRTMWNIQINNWFRGHDPFGHPVSASISWIDDWTTGFQSADIVQMHAYNYNNNSSGIDWANLLANTHHYYWNTYNKPTYIGEFGTMYENAVLGHVHYAAWAALVSGGAIIPLDWNDGGDWDDFGDAIYTNLGYLADFVSDIEFHKWNLSPGDINTNSNFYAWGMVGDQHAFAWLADKTPGEAVVSAPITINDLSSGTWQVSWYNTWTGQYVNTETIVVNGTVTLSAPDFYKDIALKFEKSFVSTVDQNTPTVFALSQNYPNPFNGSTTIHITVPYSENVSINIYNIQGQPIKTVINDKIEPGNYKFNWEGLDNHGKMVSSGLYIFSYMGTLHMDHIKIIFMK